MLPSARPKEGLQGRQGRGPGGGGCGMPLGLGTGGGERGARLQIARHEHCARGSVEEGSPTPGRRVPGSARYHPPGKPSKSGLSGERLPRGAIPSPLLRWKGFIRPRRPLERFHCGPRTASPSSLLPPRHPCMLLLSLSSECRVPLGAPLTLPTGTPPAVMMDRIFIILANLSLDFFPFVRVKALVGDSP